MKLRPLIAAALVVPLVTLVPTQASAHAALSGSNPKDGATLSAPPEQFSVSLNEPVQAPAQIAVMDPDGKRVNSRTVDVRDKTATSHLVGDTKPGKYSMSYRVVSADGHPVSGTIRFTIKGQATPDPEPSQTQEVTPPPPANDSSTTGTRPSSSGDESRTTEILVLSGVLAVLLIGAGVLFSRGTREPSDSADQP